MNLVTLTPFYKVIADSISRALDGTCYVTRGCAPTANGTGLRVDVSAGDSVEGGTPHSGYVGGNVTCATAPATPKYRRDIVYRDSAGTLTVASGTATLLTSTTPVPPALPANATLLAVVFIAPGQTTLASTDVEDCRQVRRDPVNFFNVKTYGAVGDDSTDDDAAVNAAMNALKSAGGGVLYFPKGVYRITTLAITDFSGFVIQGAGNYISVIRGPNATNPVVLNISGAASAVGDSSNFVIRDIGVAYNGASTNTTGIRIWNCVHYTLENVSVTTNGIPITNQGSGNGVFINVEAYISQSPVATNAGLMVGNGGGTVTSSGPLAIIGGQIQGGGTNGCPALILSGGWVGISLRSTQFSCPGGALASVVQIDGAPGSSTVSFDDCHSESSYNGVANTGVDFLIGNSQKPDSVAIRGGVWYGHGDGAHYQQYGVKVVACKSLRLENVTWSKLNATNGYSGACVRLESTAGAAGDTINFTGLNQDTVTTLYSDARSPSYLTTSDTGDYVLQGVIGKQSGVGSRTAGDLTTTSTSLIDATDVTTTIVLPSGTSGKVLATASGSHYSDTLGANHYFSILVDGTAVKQVREGIPRVNAWNVFSVTHLVSGLAAGSHTIKLQWAAASGDNAVLAGGTVATVITSITAVEL